MDAKHVLPVTGLAVEILLPRGGRACDICGCFVGITPCNNPCGRSLMHRYPLPNQAGTGTTDGFVYANYIGGFLSFGPGVNGSYRRSMENTFRNSLAPSTAACAGLFYRVPLGESWQVYPLAQFFYEKTEAEHSTAASPASTP